MVWTDAGRVVADMEDAKAIRERAVRKLPRQPVSHDKSANPFDLAVAGAAQGTGPWPAGIRTRAPIYLLPEAIKQWPVGLEASVVSCDEAHGPALDIPPKALCLRGKFGLLPTPTATKASLVNQRGHVGVTPDHESQRGAVPCDVLMACAILSALP